MTDLDRLAQALHLHFHPGVLRPDYGWEHPPQNVLDCLLSFKRSYRADDPFVTYRVQQFTRRRPEITTLAALKRLLEGYDTLMAFGACELDYTQSSPGNPTAHPGVFTHRAR